MCTSGNRLGDNESQNDRDESQLKSIREAVLKNLVKSHKASKQRYDLRSRPIEYVVGETVWKRTFPLSDANKGFAAKLAPKFIKCIIKRKIGLSSFELEDSAGKKLGVFSAKDLKKI